MKFYKKRDGVRTVNGYFPFFKRALNALKNQLIITKNT